MRFLRRKVQGTETVREEGRVIHREIEITVEREWLLVPTREQEDHKQEERGVPMEMPPLELPPGPKLE
jgi:hypothetical protein